MIEARLDGGDWELPLTTQETAALLDNVAASLKICDAFGIIAVLIGPRFVIRLADVLVERYEYGLCGVIWAALDPVGGWGSCQCPGWKAERSCGHVDALRERAMSPASSNVLAFPGPARGPGSRP